MSYDEMIEREGTLARRVARWLVCLVILAFFVWASA